MTTPARPLFDPQGNPTSAAPAPLFDPSGNPLPLPTQVGRLTVSTDRARKTQPDVLADAFAIGRRLGMPAEVVAANIEQVRAMEGDADFNPQTFTTDHPQTAAWLHDEMNAGVSRDDWANLGRIERLVGRDWRMVQTPIGPLPVPARPGLLAREAMRGMAGLRLAELSFNTTPDERALMAPHLAELREQASAPLPDATNLAERGLRGVFRYVLPSMAVVAEESGKGAAIGGSGGLAVGAVSGPGALAMGAAGATLGAVAGAFKKSWELVGGEAIDAFSQVVDDNGDPLDPQIADAAGRAVGLLGAVPEVVGLGAIVRPFGRAAASVLARGTARALAVPTTRAAIVNGVRAGADAFGTEVSTELIQTAMQLAGERVAREVASGDQPFSETAVGFERFRDEMAATAVETALSMAWVGGVGGVTTTVADYARVVEANTARDRMLALGESAEASVLRQRSPEKFREVVERDIEKNGAVRDVLLPVERFTAYWQSKNIDPQAVAADLGIAEQYTEALEHGGDVVIPLPDYATKIAPTEHGAALAEDIRLRPGQLTAREAKALDARIETDVTALRDEMETATPENDAEQRVVDDVVAQLTNAAATMPSKTRYTPEQVATMAAAIARPYLSLARRSGQDAFALYQRKNLRIVGPDVAEPMFDAGQAESVNQLPFWPEGFVRGELRPSQERIIEQAVAAVDREFGTRTLTDERLPWVSPEQYHAAFYDLLQRGEDVRALDDPSVRPEVLRQDKSPENLVITHNISESKLTNAIRIGGLPVPSLAVTPADRTLEGFGEITLIGPSEMADPKGRFRTRVFGADVYSPRYPTVEYNIDKVTANRIRNILKGFGSEAELKYIASDLEGIVQSKPFERYAAAKLGVAAEEVRWHDGKKIGEELLREVEAPERIFRGFTEMGNRRYIPHTLENVVKILKKDLRGGENFNYGVGSVRAKFTPQFRSVAQIKKEKGRLTDKASFDAIKREVDDEFFAIAESLELSPDQTIEVVEDAAKMTPKRSLERAFKDYRDGAEVTDEQVRMVGDFALKLRDLPTEYFEAKILREVGIEEFVAALVPSDVTPEVRKMLEGRGLKVVEYDKNDEGARNAALSALESGVADQVFFQQSDQRPNAFLALGVNQDTIGLMKDANLSSVLHEFAHDWLNLLADLATQPNASPELVAEWQTVMTELGIESRDQLGDAEQEHWARAFEKYLADGQAPTRDLGRMFSRFKAWMRAVYQAALANFASVSPQLRGVFDRMFIAEQATVEAMQATEPLVESAEEGGMTDAEFAAHQRAYADSKERSEAQLLAQLLAEENKDRREGWAERKAAIEVEVRAEVEARPVQRAVKFLRAKTTPKEGRPAKAMLVARYGPNITKTLPRGTFTVEGGIDPDVVAFAFGLESGDALVTQLQAYEVPEAIIQRETDARLRREFPDLVNDSPALADEAQRQVHHAVHDDLILSELKALGRSDASVPAPNIKAVKRIAQEMIDATPVRDVRPHRFLLAERKANRLAKESLRKGDIPRAAFHGRQQLLNHILYRYAVKAVAMGDRALRFFSRMGKDSMRAKLGLAGDIYRDAMDALLNDYEFVRTSNVALDRRAKLNAWLDRMEEEGLPVEVPPSVREDAAQRNYRTLPVGNLRDVYETGKQIHTTATNKGKLIDAKRSRDVEATEREMVVGIAAHHTLEPRARDYAPTRFKWARTMAAKMDAWHVKPEFLFTWLDGEQRDGPVWRNLFQPIAEAEANESRMIREMLPNLQAIFDRIPKATRKAWLARRVQVGNARLTGEQVFALALNWGNLGNREAVVASRVDGMPEWTQEDVQRALATMTADEWAAVQTAWDVVDTYWPEISAMQRRLVGVAPEKVEATPFTVTTSDGQTVEMRGGYYPLAYDREYSWSQEKIEQQRDVQELGEWGYTKAATRHGHTESRVGSGGKPVKLDLSVLGEHLLNVIHDLTHREAVINTQRLIEREGVRTTITQAAGSEMYGMLAPWLKRVAADRLPPASPVESFLGRARRGATVVNMGLKATTAIVQPMGYFQSIDYLGAKYARKGMAAFLKNPKTVWDFAQESSETIRGRRESFDREARDLLKQQATGERDWQGTVARASMFFTGLADMSVSVPTWYGAYLKEMDAHGDHEAAVLAGDQAVRMTQGSGAAKDLARIQGGGETQRIFTLFYSYFSVLYNQMRRSARMVKGPSDVPRFLGSMALLWFLPAVLSELVAQRGPEDDEDWAEWAAWELARYPLSSVIGVRDVASAVGPDAYEYEMSPVVEAYRSLAEATNALGATVFADEEMSRSDWRKVVNAAGYWGQLPTRQGWITGTYLYDWMMGYEAPETPIEAGRNLMFTRPR